MDSQSLGTKMSLSMDTENSPEQGGPIHPCIESPCATSNSESFTLNRDPQSEGSEMTVCDEDYLCRQRLLDRVSRSEGHFKHQQRGEPDLTHSQKLEIATDLLDNKPSVFLTRFGKYLESEDLNYFRSMSDDYMIGFHLTEIRKRLNVHANQTMVRNRRFEAMKQLVKEGEYFDDEFLKQRDPLMYEQMVGQYLDGEEIGKQIDKSDLRFSTILLSHLDIIRNNELYEKQKDIEAAQMEDQTDSDDEEDEADKDEESEEESELESEEDEPKATISLEEKQRLREEFLKTMQLRFLNGEDVDFDYTKVDTNEEYDSLDIRERDEQERYFDKEDPETIDMDTDCQDTTPCPSSINKVDAGIDKVDAGLDKVDADLSKQAPSVHHQSSAEAVSMEQSETNSETLIEDER